MVQENSAQESDLTTKMKQDHRFLCLENAIGTAKEATSHCAIMIGELIGNYSTLEENITRIEHKVNKVVDYVERRQAKLEESGERARRKAEAEKLLASKLKAEFDQESKAATSSTKYQKPPVEELVKECMEMVSKVVNMTKDQLVAPSTPAKSRDEHSSSSSESSQTLNKDKNTSTSGRGLQPSQAPSERSLQQTGHNNSKRGRGRDVRYTRY